MGKVLMSLFNFHAKYKITNKTKNKRMQTKTIGLERERKMPQTRKGRKGKQISSLFTNRNFYRRTIGISCSFFFPLFLLFFSKVLGFHHWMKPESEPAVCKSTNKTNTGEYIHARQIRIRRWGKSIKQSFPMSATPLTKKGKKEKKCVSI